MSELAEKLTKLIKALDKLAKDTTELVDRLKELMAKEEKKEE